MVEKRKSKFANNGTLSKVRRERQRKYDAKARYGLTLEMAKILREGVCEICGKHPKKMVIDHVIKGSYRGVLCQQCNTRLGWLESRLEKILSYIAYANAGKSRNKTKKKKK